MSNEEKEIKGKVIEEIESLVDEVNKAVRVAVDRGSDAAEHVGENLKDAIKETLHGVRSGVRSARDSVVMVRVNKESLARLDELVEAGVANSRSQATAFLVDQGIKARQDLFDKIAEKIEQIRKAKEELRQLLEED